MGHVLILTVNILLQNFGSKARSSLFHVGVNDLTLHRAYIRKTVS